MNFRTTLIMAAILAGLALVYFWRPRGSSLPATLEKTPGTPASSVVKDALDHKPGDIIKIVARTKGGEEMVFEKSPDPGTAGDQPSWRMTKPREMKVASYEVDRIHRQITGLKYELSHKPGQPGAVTAAQAGLEPPEAAVSVSDAGGETSTVEIGKAASSDTTYVRVAGQPEILVATTSLRNLLKTKLLEYRDPQLWTFAPDKATRVEIIDRNAPGESVNYVFIRDGARWMMESPASAKATAKVDEMVQAMSRLRAVKWEDDRPQRLSAYGFEPAVLTVRATVTEMIPAEKKDQPNDSAENPDSEETVKEDGKATLKQTVYELELSAQAPIGEDSKVYMRAGGEPAVATVMKTISDKFRPIMTEWREMRLTTANAVAATRIETSTPAASAILEKKDGTWSFEGDGAKAEASAVDALLKAIQNLSAVAFVEAKPLEAPAMGFTKPQADIRLVIPGVDGVERITVGGYTEPGSKRLVYVRRNESSSVAKVKASEVTALLQTPRALRDRTLLDVPQEQIHRVGLSTENPLTAERVEVVFEHRAGEWVMVSPVQAEIRHDRINKLVASLGHLSGTAIVADEGQLTAYGLHAPAATVTVNYQPVLQGEGTDNTPGASQQVVLMATEHDGKHYAKRADRPTIYEVSEDFYKSLFEEFRTVDIFTFDPKKVRQFSIRTGGHTHVFDRAEGKWKYRPEPDLPLDAKKVDTLLTQINDLKTEQYVAHGPAEPSQFGLSSPFHEVVITLEDATTKTLHVSDSRDGDPKHGSWATTGEGRGVFLLAPDMVAHLTVSLDQLEVTNKP